MQQLTIGRAATNNVTIMAKAGMKSGRCSQKKSGMQQQIIGKAATNNGKCLDEKWEMQPKK